jgi:hypothetical protein
MVGCGRDACENSAKILTRRVSQQPEILSTKSLCVECSRRRDESNGDGIDSLKCVVVAPLRGGGEKRGIDTQLAMADTA